VCRPPLLVFFGLQWGAGFPALADLQPLWLTPIDWQERRAHNKRCAGQDTKRLRSRRKIMDSIIYLVGLIVVVMFILSALGLR
jgi:hypothetical protein